MSFILRIYQMSEAENAVDFEHDRKLREAELINAKEFYRRCAARRFARRQRRDDDAASAGSSVAQRPSSAVLH
jgi:hypothetical protein